MLSLIVNFFFCLLSLFVYFLAPEQYSYGYCLFILIFYLIIFTINVFVNDLKEGFGFGILFSISFLFSNFIYPVFYIIDYTYVSSFVFSYNENVVNRSTAVALVGYCFYVLALTDYGNKYTALKKFRNKPVVSAKAIYLVVIGLFLAVIFFVFLGGYSITRAVYSGQLGVTVDINSIYGYFQILIFVFSVMLASIYYYSDNYLAKKISLYSILFVAIFMLSTGTRLLALNLFIILIAVYSREVNKISIKKTILFTFFGANVLYILMLIRENQGLNFSFENNSLSGLPFDVFIDLIGTNRNLYVLYDYVEKNGSLLFLNELPVLLSTFPFASFFIDLIPIETYKTSGLFPTYLTFGPNASYGLGTSMVGEAYLSLGIIGVVTVFFGFGLVIKKVKLASLSSIYFSVIYFYLVSQSVFYPRIDYFWGIKNIVWMCLLLVLINYFVRNKRY